jgi:hypothetical protein
MSANDDDGHKYGVGCRYPAAGNPFSDATTPLRVSGSRKPDAGPFTF